MKTAIFHAIYFIMSLVILSGTYCSLQKDKDRRSVGSEHADNAVRIKMKKVNVSKVGHRILHHHLAEV